MTPDELEDLAKMEEDQRFSAERSLGFCAKMKHFFFEQTYHSHLETYLNLREQDLSSAPDFSQLDNEHILALYGIEIPDDVLNSNQQPHTESERQLAEAQQNMGRVIESTAAQVEEEKEKLIGENRSD